MHSISVSLRRRSMQSHFIYHFFFFRSLYTCFRELIYWTMTCACDFGEEREREKRIIKMATLRIDTSASVMCFGVLFVCYLRVSYKSDALSSVRQCEFRDACDSEQSMCVAGKKLMKNHRDDNDNALRVSELSEKRIQSHLNFNAIDSCELVTARLNGWMTTSRWQATNRWTNRRSIRVT